MTPDLIFLIMRWWLTIGVFVAVVFLTFGVDRIDEDARGAYVFRPLLVPGILLIWPLVLWRWFRLETGSGLEPARYRPVRSAHFITSIVMAALIAAVIFIGLSQRQSWPSDFAPQQLSAPGE